MARPNHFKNKKGNIVPDIHLQRLKKIEPFINKRKFDIKAGKKFTASQKAKILRYSRYFEQPEVQAAFKYADTFYRPKSATNRAIASRATGIKTRLSIKGLPIRTGGVEAQVSVKKGRLVIQNKYVTEEYIPLDPVLLLANGTQYINEVIDDFPTTNRYQIKAGAHFVGQSSRDKSAFSSFSRGTVGAEIITLMSQYDGEDGRSDWEDWLLGITSIEVDKDNQEKLTLAQYKKVYAKSLARKKGRK